MSSLLNPVGPEPASVYWRRRIIVVLGILAVLALVWWMLSPGGSQSPTSAQPSPTPLPTLTAAESPSAAPSAAPSTSASGAACSDTDISVSVTMDQQSYAAGSPVEFIMKITNSGSVACVRDVGPAANTFTVTSGGFDVWSSDACSDPGDSQEEEIPPGEAFAVKGTWDGSVNSSGCENTVLAEAGAYQVEAGNGDVGSDAVTFSLT
jgi:hypothetical protein